MKRVERSTVDWPAVSLIRDIVNWQYHEEGVSDACDSTAPRLHTLDLAINGSPQGFVATTQIPIPHRESVTGRGILRQNTGVYRPIGNVGDDIWQPRGVMWSVSAIMPEEMDGAARVDWAPGVSMTAKVATEAPLSKREGWVDALKRQWGGGMLFSVAEYALCVEHNGKPSLLASAERTSGRREMTNEMPIPPFVLMESTRQRRLNECKRRLARVAGTLEFITSMLPPPRT